MRPFKSLVGGGGSSSKSSVENSNDNYNNPLIPASELIFEEESLALLGKGGFGSVRKALLKNRNTSSSTSKAAVVAVKSLSISPQSLDPLEAIELFVSEAKKMRELKHTRIVGFIGFVLESFSIVMEFLPSGTLQEFLKTHKRVDVEWKVRCQLAEDVAEGMAYLHSKKTLRGEAKIQVFHQDLKPANVLLSIENDVLRGKISDFGLSAIKDKAANDQSLSAATNIESFVMHLGGSKVYMAPELQFSRNYTKSCDVFSYGVILFELITFYPPWELSDFDKHIKAASVTHVLEGLVRSCVHFTPTNRPDFETITIALQSLRETEQGETSGLQSFTPLTNESNDTSFIGNGGGQAKQVGQIAASENNDSSYINSSLFRANKQPPTKNSKSNRNPRTSNARQTNVIAFSKRTCCIFGIFVVLICVIVVTIVFVVGRSTSGANTSTSNSGSTSASTPTSSTQTSSLQTPIVILPSTQQFVQATVWFDGGGGKGKDSATTSIAMYSGIAVFGFQNGTTVQVDVSTGSIIKTFPKVSLSPISSLSIDKNDGHVCMIYSDGTALIADIFSSNVSFTQNVTNSQFRDSDCRFPFLYTQYQGNGYCKFNLFESNSSAATTSSATLGPFFPAKVVAVGRGANRDYIGLANGQIWEIQLWYDGVASLIYSLPSPVQFLSLRGRELYVYTTSQIVWSIHFYDWKVRWQVDVSLISSGVVDMKATDMSVFLLTQTSLFSLDSSGNTLSQIPVTFADGFIPMQMEISSGFAYIIGSSSNVVRVNLMMVVSQASNNATITPFMKSSKPTPWFQNSWENIPSYLINTDGLFVIGYSDGNAEVISPLATSVEETMLWAGESPQNPVNLAINTMFIDPEHGYACIDHSGGVVNAFDEQLWGWWVGSVTSTTTSSKAGIYCMWPWVIWSRGMTMYVTDFYSSPSPVIINTFGFQSSIVSFAAGLNGWLYVGLDDGSVHQYITLNNTATALINRSSSQAAGISFVRVWGDKVFALYSNMTLTRISISAHRVEWSVNLSSILAQALSSSSSTTIVEMCVQDTVLLILTSSAKMYQFDVNNPLTVQNIIYSLLPIQQATAMTISQGYVFVGVPQDTTAMGVFTFALTGI